MERSYQKYGLMNLLALLAVGGAMLGAARYVHSLAGHVAALHLGLGALVAFVCWFQLRLEERERAEQLEFDELARAKGSATLFEARQEEVLPARRAREQFERYFVPIFTAVLFLLQTAGAWLLWRWLSKQTLPPLSPPLVAMALFGLFALVLFLLGKFAATLARLENQRLLRPSGDYVLFGAYLCMAAALAVVGLEAGWPRADALVARVLVGMLLVVAAETLVNLILEMYRPRVKGRVSRPVYESRLVGLMGKPEGLVTTAAEALDYQFGFKVSETWFYRFFERALGRLLLMQLGVLLLSTCWVVVEPGEQALLERLGRRRAVLTPGGHLKLPWPVDRVYRYRTEQIQTFTVGIAPEEKAKGGDTAPSNTILWTVAHGQEDLFLVANREQDAARSAAAEPGRQAPPVSLLVVNVPIHFQIHDLLQWAYEHKDAAALLKNLATREIVRYLVSADLGEIMAQGRATAAEALRVRIQTVADANRLGATILFVGLQGIHPPVKVAGDYEKVVSAVHQKVAKVLAAQADAIRTNALAGARAYVTTNEAAADSLRVEVSALARAAAFTNQVPAFNAAPTVYPLRAYLQTFARATANARKYVLLTTNTEDIVQLDLQDKIRQDLLDITVPPPKK